MEQMRPVPQESVSLYDHKSLLSMLVEKFLRPFTTAMKFVTNPVGFLMQAGLQRKLAKMEEPAEDENFIPPSSPGRAFRPPVMPNRPAADVLQDISRQGAVPA